MLEHSLGTVDQQKLSSTLVPPRLRFAFLVATAMVLPGHAQSTRPLDASPWNDRESSAPNLSEILPETDLLGKPFHITENGPEACLCIENEKLVLCLDGEKFFVHKICTIDGTVLDLTPGCIATCRTVATLRAQRDGVIGRVTIPFFPTLEQHMGCKQMLAIAEEIGAEKQTHHPQDSISVEWKDVYGRPQGTVTLERLSRVPALASR
ncbi:MAG: hypothetical protein Greene041662_534 [Candidatus Peregrinibacteria bacterium Greene0416_62]|nr:MAG: hypothetical protein Greene041662_534 [Candidatus Peregrinibacteria bacterium Greene0416_62]TSC99844.1 MAG: hypothetical protein Greene101449_483 [Candidatus Peregrinibacteria bacterium Greene1014_49]